MPASEPSVPTPSQRLLSLDALRGFDMFWIIGADSLVAGLEKISSGGPIQLVAEQLEHSAWEGFNFEDLIFPLFVFITGILVVFATSQSDQRPARRAAIWRIFRRAILLYLFGILYYGGFATSFLDIRLLGVLQRIALCYLVAALLFLYLRPRYVAGVCAGLLIGYWAMMTFIPVPVFGSGNFGEGKNLANYLDAQFLPLRKWDGDHDPEGLLSTLPAIATCLLGVLAGLLLKSKSHSDQAKVLWLVGAGAAGVLAGWFWGLQFPVVKKIWTSSYVLVAAGYSALLLALFYQVIEIWKWKGWATPFVWIGTNSIVIYMAANLIDFQRIARRIAGGDVERLLGDYGTLAIAIVGLMLELWCLRFLYRHKIFLRL